MPEPFDSVDTAFLHLLVPAFFVSIIVTSTSGYHPIFPRLFRSSLLVSIDTTSTLSLSLQLPQLRRHSFPSLPLSLLRSSFFVSIVQTSTLSLSFQSPWLRRHSFHSLPLSLLRSSFFVSLGNAFSSLVRTFTSFLLSYLFHHSIPVSEVPTYRVKETRVPEFFSLKQSSVHLVPRTWQLERRRPWSRLV